MLQPCADDVPAQQVFAKLPHDIIHVCVHCPGSANAQDVEPLHDHRCQALGRAASMSGHMVLVSSEENKMVSHQSKVLRVRVRTPWAAIGRQRHRTPARHKYRVCCAFWAFVPLSLTFTCAITGATV
jgi:hypothetical protein